MSKVEHKATVHVFRTEEKKFAPEYKNAQI